MRIDKVHIKSQFKNLNNFEINIDEESMETVLLGQNASGKSTFLEALILIFKHLDLETSPRRKPKEETFDYFIKYKCREREVEIDLTGTEYSFKIAGNPIKASDFFANKNLYLPRFIFSYYSGYNDRLEPLFWGHQNRYYDTILNEEKYSREEKEFRRLFRFNPAIHSRMAALSFFAFENEEQKSVDFLRDILNIETLESILLVLEKPDWAKKEKKDRFWGAKGMVRSFLDTAWSFALAPIYHTETVSLDFRKTASKERLYLYISDAEKLKRLALYYKDNLHLFQALESTFISSMIDEIRVQVRKKNQSESLPYRDLSEGEQQLLGVLGAINFIKGEESLILLDEPDTHLNPLWKWQYLKYLRQFVENQDTTQIIINTHDPLVIGGLTKEQICIFRTDKETGFSEVSNSSIDPKGLGVAGILTSPIFDLPTTLDEGTQKILNRKRALQGRMMIEDLSEKEMVELRTLTDYMEELGFYDTTTDKDFNQFLLEYSQHPLYPKVIRTEEEEETLKKFRAQIFERILSKKN